MMAVAQGRARGDRLSLTAKRHEVGRRVVATAVIIYRRPRAGLGGQLLRTSAPDTRTSVRNLRRVSSVWRERSTLDKGRVPMAGGGAAPSARWHVPVRPSGVRLQSV